MYHNQRPIVTDNTEKRGKRIGGKIKEGGLRWRGRERKDKRKGSGEVNRR